MADVPQIVRDRLRAQAVASEHPDANLLSAFAEHTLAEQERAQVLDHVSRCADCRQVVALSAPEVEEERRVAAAVAVRPSADASRSWWRSPVVHWGALTAAALVVLIAVGERMRLRQGQSASAPAIATYEPAQKSETPAPETASAPTEQKESRKPAQTAKPPRHADTFNAPRPMGAGSGGKVASGDKVAAGIGTGASAGVGVQNLPPHPPPPATQAQANSDRKTGGSRLESKIAQAQAKAVPAPPAATDEVEVTTVEAAPVLKSERGAAFAKRAILGPRWSVSDSGAVQRSFDGGRSWKDVAIADGVSFRAVASAGSDVWTGGSGGALFHSADGGEHWSRVRVQANGRAPSGDIVRIEFTDARDGVVATSTGETWTTSDAGATWQRQ